MIIWWNAGRFVNFFSSIYYVVGLYHEFDSDFFKYPSHLFNNGANEIV